MMLREWYIREALEKKKTVKKHTPDKIVLFYHETARLLKSAWFWKVWKVAFLRADWHDHQHHHQWHDHHWQLPHFQLNPSSLV